MTVQISPEIELSDGTMMNVALDYVFSARNIAHSLSMACRFGNQPRVFYSVAQHCVLVSRIMEREGGNPLEGLLHDAAEFVYNDLATPIKYNCEGFLKQERDLQARINRYFGLRSDKSVECHRADKMAMFMEAYDLIPSKGMYMPDPLEVRQEAWHKRGLYEAWLVPDTWEEAKFWWLKRFMELT